MGLVSDESGSKSIFSNNILRLEISSPNEDYLSVIDVPGIFKRTTSRILKKAEEVNPDGIRTLGVLIKPDLVDKGAEKDVIDLVEGRKYQLKLGWYILRNAGQVELRNPVADRHATERGFFAGQSL
ncbi:MAG: hypothetical protein Q9176_006475 [Flavoplaca citrina]